MNIIRRAYDSLPTLTPRAVMGTICATAPGTRDIINSVNDDVISRYSSLLRRHLLAPLKTIKAVALTALVSIAHLFTTLIHQIKALARLNLRLAGRILILDLKILAGDVLFMGAGTVAAAIGIFVPSILRIFNPYLTLQHILLTNQRRQRRSNGQTFVRAFANAACEQAGQSSKQPQQQEATRPTVAEAAFPASDARFVASDAHIKDRQPPQEDPSVMPAAATAQ